MLGFVKSFDFDIDFDMGGCFPCFGSSNKEDTNAVKEVSKKESFKEASLPQSHHPTRVSSDKSKSRSVSDSKKEKEAPVPKDGATAHIAAQTFTFRELAAATKNFRPECLLGEGGFGRVYKGCLESTKQVSCGSCLLYDEWFFSFHFIVNILGLENLLLKHQFSIGL